MGGVEGQRGPLKSDRLNAQQEVVWTIEEETSPGVFWNEDVGMGETITLTGLERRRVGGETPGRGSAEEPV